METPEEQKLQQFLPWLEVNKVQLRGCKIKYCGANKGFGLLYDSSDGDGILLVVPLDLAITPMRVLQDPLLGPRCRAMFEEGEVDDRFLMNLFLTVERLRKNSAWKPYLDILPTTFGNSLWFTDDELLELKGTTLYRATELQKKNLRSLYEDKVKNLVMEILDGESEREVHFQDFLWANSIFWARALNIPFPRCYVFPQTSNEMSNPERVETGVCEGQDENGVTSISAQGDTVWVEGLVPGIDFCNHDLRPAATWEVDGSGLTTGVPASMYLLSAEKSPFQIDKEIFISYGNKGNEELLYLYGFAIKNNTDDYLMVHYPLEAMQSNPFADSKTRLLEIQKAEIRCLLPQNLLDNGFFAASPQDHEDSCKTVSGRTCNYSWSSQRKMPSYSNKLVFPEDFLTALRTIAMKEEELLKVSSLLEELVGSREEREPSDTEVRAAVWEACGDSAALQLLVDLLQIKIMELEEGSGTEASDTDLLENAIIAEISEEQTREMTGEKKLMSRNIWASIVYRRGQKQLTRLFLKEAEHALQLSLAEES